MMMIYDDDQINEEENDDDDFHDGADELDKDNANAKSDT